MSSKTQGIAAAICSWLVLAQTQALGVSPTLAGAVVAPAGGSSAGGAFEMKSTAGQESAGDSNGGRFSLATGLWPKVRLALPLSRLVITITRTNNLVTISWPHDSAPVTIEFAKALGASWIPLDITPSNFGDTDGILLDTTTIVDFGFIRLRRL